jgi:transposase
MTIVEDTRAIAGGVDTHAGMHVAAALDPLGGLPGVREFPATAAGYADLLSWLGGFGDVALAGVEGAGSYGAGLARYLATARVWVVEVDRADRQDRHRAGKPDPLDAVSAARAALSGRAAGAPEGRDGAVEAIRAASRASSAATVSRRDGLAFSSAHDAHAALRTPRPAPRDRRGWPGTSRSSPADAVRPGHGVVPSRWAGRAAPRRSWLFRGRRRLRRRGRIARSLPWWSGRGPG